MMSEPCCGTVSPAGRDHLLRADDFRQRRVAQLLAVAPGLLGGVILRGGSARRQGWLQAYTTLCGAGRPVRIVPRHCDDDTLLGGLDLVRTLALRRPVAAPGLLAEAHGGTLVLQGAERLDIAAAARIVAAMDRGRVAAGRGGLFPDRPACFAVVACEEAANEDEGVPDSIADRLAFQIDLEGDSNSTGDAAEAELVASARALLPRVIADIEIVDALCRAALALGVTSLRAPMLALYAARVAAALGGRDVVAREDAEEAVAFVLAPRATRMAAVEDEIAADDAAEEEVEDEATPEPSERGTPPAKADAREEGATGGRTEAERAPTSLAEVLVASAAAHLPPELLKPNAQACAAGRANGAGRAGPVRQLSKRGRPVGVRKGVPRGGARLSLIATLRAAAPWQSCRRASLAARRDRRAAVEIRSEDLHVKRLKHSAETATIFVVDASGSSALERMAEAKGAVELLLSRCYQRRDWVALISFRRSAAELVLPPTHALARAKRVLRGFAGGGGTPLASALELARLTAEGVRRKGQQPSVVLLTDGRANVCRDGTGDRLRAGEEACAAARALARAGLNVIVIDISPQPRAEARKLAAEARGSYVPLPHARAGRLAAAIDAEVRNSA